MSEALAQRVDGSPFYHTLETFSPEQDLIRRTFLGRVAIECDIDWEIPSAMNPHDIEERFEWVDIWLGRWEQLNKAQAPKHMLLELAEDMRDGKGKADFVNSGLTPSTYNGRLRRLYEHIGVAFEAYCAPGVASADALPPARVAESRLKPFMDEGASRHKATILAAQKAGWTKEEMRIGFNTTNLYLVEDLPTAYAPPARQLMKKSNKPTKQEVLTAEEEVELAKYIEAGAFAEQLLNNLAQTSKDKVKVGDAMVTRADLLMLVKEKNKALFEFVEKNVGLVRSVVVAKWGSIMMSGVQRSEIYDLIEDVKFNENRGLLHAIYKFDFALGYKFSTYALDWIDNGLYEALGARQKIPVGGEVHRSFLNMQRAWKRISEIPPQERTPEERAFINNGDPELASLAIGDAWLADRKQSGLTYQYLRDRLNMKLVNADETVKGRDGSVEERRIERLRPEIESAPDTEAVVNVVKEQVFTAALQHLTKREQVIVTNLFGLGDAPIASPEELCAHYGWNMAIFKTWRAQALKKMRPYLKVLYEE